MEQAQITQICLNTFAKHFNIAVNTIKIIQVKEQAIQLQEPPKPGEVITGLLSRCFVHNIESPVGDYKLYMRTNGKGNVYWNNNS